MTESSSPERPILTIVIPALNEEEAIGSTISRCLDVSDEICRTAHLESVEIIVVSDGSTDRTAEIARGFKEVRVIEFERNWGYGAAIKEGFQQGRGSLLSFLDADGTCNPSYFAEMCRLIVEEGAEIVLGSRLGPDSQMPTVRRIGNRLYAVLLGILCGRRITDTASGMRVLTRSAFEQVSPLPSGLHFTPSMSARALISGLRVVEVPMAYAERIGASKLNVISDGVRFVRTIVAGILIFRPDRLFLLALVPCLLLMMLMGAYPVEYYLQHGALEEWMIYRFLACFLLGASGFSMLCAAALAHQMARLGPLGQRTDSFWSAAAARLFGGWRLACFVATALIGSLILLWPGIVEYLTSWTCTLHWSRMVVASFFLLAASQAVITAVLIETVKMWAYRKSDRESRARRDVAPPGAGPNRETEELIERTNTNQSRSLQQ